MKLKNLKLSNSNIFFNYFTGSTGEILQVDFKGCEIPPCVVERPFEYYINITFKAG